jgi:nesprin-1
MTKYAYRQSRFLVWASDVESRVDKGSVTEDPEEVLRRLETELQAEVALKSREVDWLLHTGSELAQAYAGDGEIEAEQRKEIESKVQQVHDTWNRLQNMSKSRANKLHDILQVHKLIECLLFKSILGLQTKGMPQKGSESNLPSCQHQL